MGEQFQIPIAKGGRGAIYVVDSDIINDLPPEVFAMVVKEGLKTLLNSRMSKLPAPTKLEGEAAEEAKEVALAKAKENFDDMMAGKLVKRSASSSKAAGVPRAVMTEAIRLAKEVAKDLIRKAGMKISHVPAKDITAAAKQFVEDDPSYIEKATVALAERATVPSTTLDITALIKESPKLKAEAEARNAAKKEKVLSAKQAGIVAKVTKTTAKVPPRRPGATAPELPVIPRLS